MSDPSTAPAQPAAPAAVAPVQPSLPLQPAAAPAIPPALAAMLTPPAAAAPADAPKAPAEPAKVEVPKAQRDAEARLAALESELASAKAATRAATIREHVIRAATEAGAIVPDQVHALLRDTFDVADDGRVVVKSDPRADPRAEVARFLAGNLHLLRPALAGGGAGTPAAVVAPTSAQSHPAFSREGGTAIAHRALASLLGVAQGNPSASPPAAPTKA